jgi:hypothetical protein
MNMPPPIYRYFDAYELQSNFVHTSVRNAFLAFSLVIYYEFIMGRSKKDPYSPRGGNFCRPEGEGRKNCF